MLPPDACRRAQRGEEEEAFLPAALGDRPPHSATDTAPERARRAGRALKSGRARAPGGGLRRGACTAAAMADGPDPVARFFLGAFHFGCGSDTALRGIVPLVHACFLRSAVTRVISPRSARRIGKAGTASPQALNFSAHLHICTARPPFSPILRSRSMPFDKCCSVTCSPALTLSWAARSLWFRPARGRGTLHLAPRGSPNGSCGFQSPRGEHPSPSRSQWLSTQIGLAGWHPYQRNTRAGSSAGWGSPRSGPRPVHHFKKKP